MSGPEGFPASVALARVDPGQEPFQVSRFTLESIDGTEETFFEFDNQTFIPFANELQLRFKLVAAADGQDLGETIIDAADAGQGQKTARFFPTVITGPSYELSYKVF